MALATLPVSALQSSFLTMEQEMNQAHLERPEVIRSLLVALVARAHVILLGPPGTGKSRLARDLCQRIVGRFFEWQLTRLSTPEELFGPISLQGLQQDHYRRIATGKLPEADIAYLDETFKASSAILNTLLAAMNERIFFNDGQALPMPLQMLIGASNELPDDREELGALWDRFLIRHVVDYVKDPNAFAALLQTAAQPTAPTQLSLHEVIQAQEAAARISVQAIIPLITQLRTDLLKQGIIASDRRWRQSLDIIKAQAWLNGHTAADATDATILQHILWNDPDQRLLVAKTVLMLISPFDQKAQDILDDAQDTYLKAINTPENEDRNKAGLEAMNMLKMADKRLKTLAAEAHEAGKPSTKITEGLQQLNTWNDNVIKTCLKL